MYNFHISVGFELGEIFKKNSEFFYSDVRLNSIQQLNEQTAGKWKLMKFK